MYSRSWFLSLPTKVSSAYIDDIKIESKANKYTFVWRKTVERNRTRLLDKIRILLELVDEAIAQENLRHIRGVDSLHALRHSR